MGADSVPAIKKRLKLPLVSFNRLAFFLMLRDLQIARSPGLLTYRPSS
jgi:hypothetical protein